MKIDMHCHAVGKGRNFNNPEHEVYFNIEDDASFFLRRFYTFFYSQLERKLVQLGADNQARDGLVSTDEYFDLVYRILAESEEVEGMVLLAFDAVYDDDGKPVIETTDLRVSNRFLSRRVKDLNRKLEADRLNHKQFYFGASVNPNRKDWKERLGFVIEDTDAVLIKWIPSVQHIRVQHVQTEFYKMLADRDMPLLSHVGPEYTFPEGIRKYKLDHYKHLSKPIEAGVRVIAAHCTPGQ